MHPVAIVVGQPPCRAIVLAGALLDRRASWQRDQSV